MTPIAHLAAINTPNLESFEFQTIIVLFPYILGLVGGLGFSATLTAYVYDSDR